VEKVGGELATAGVDVDAPSEADGRGDLVAGEGVDEGADVGLGGGCDLCRVA